MEQFVSNIKEAQDALPDFDNVQADKVLDEITPELFRSGAIIAGGFVASYLSKTKFGNDIDVWFPAYTTRYAVTSDFEKKGWKISYDFDIDHNKKTHMSPDVCGITEMVSPKYKIKLQLIFTKISNIYDVVDNFDFDACKGIYSPGLDQEGKLIGFRATKPEVRQAIESQKAIYLHHVWDLEEHKLHPKALNRFKKYMAKGYEITIHPKSFFNMEQILEMIKEQEKKPKQETADSFYSSSDKFSRYYKIRHQAQDWPGRNDLQNFYREYEWFCHHNKKDLNKEDMPFYFSIAREPRWKTQKEMNAKSISIAYS
jgi:hypothetical protein